MEKPNENDVLELKELWKEAFGDSDAFLDTFFSKVYNKDRTRILRIENKIASALYFFRCEFDKKDIVYLYAIQTKKEFRGRGLCNALMADTHKELSAMGFKGAILCPASNPLFKFYEKIGYKTSAYINEEKAVSQKGHIALSQISAEEYTLLRKDLLPPKGIIQEKENLDFLRTETTFYKSEDTLFACRKHAKKLFCMEFWGNKDFWGKILYSLNCTEGVFRTVGNDKPFAMYLPFDGKDTDYPEYLGFAFD